MARVPVLTRNARLALRPPTLFLQVRALKPSQPERSVLSITSLHQRWSPLVETQAVTFASGWAITGDA
jgi:hypothetical protein